LETGVASPKAILFVLLGAVAAVFCTVWAGDLVASKRRRTPNAFHFVVGFVDLDLILIRVASTAEPTRVEHWSPP
jgi:hypothetical protein